MQSYWLFVGFSVVAIATPGPGVLLTVSNALRYGFSRSLPGILGLAIGMLGVGLVSGAGLGAIMLSSAAAFSIVKYVGAGYLIYLGATRLLTKPSPVLTPGDAAIVSSARKFSEGAAVTLLNPKAYLLYASLFPHFVDPARGYVNRLTLLALTFSGLMVVIHSIYCAIANVARRRVLSGRWASIFDRATGGLLVGLGVGVAVSTK